MPCKTEILGCDTELCNGQSGKRGDHSADEVGQRLQRLRIWLLHFITNLNAFVMECILEAAHMSFDESLESVRHLGQIAESHMRYIRAIHHRCLQKPSAAFLRDAINEVGRKNLPLSIIGGDETLNGSIRVRLQVLSIALQVVKAWKTGITLQDVTKLEQSYARHHQYVADVLETEMAHEMLPNGMTAPNKHGKPMNFTNRSRFRPIYSGNIILCPHGEHSHGAGERLNKRGKGR